MAGGGGVFPARGEEARAGPEAPAPRARARHVTPRHEQGAAFMADVPGRLTGRCAVAMATLGPGATNLVTGIADAYLDRAPMVALTGQTGIDIRLVAGMSNSGGTTRVCAELSWDGGATWTAPKSVALSGNTPATYAIGGASDTWGRAWTAAELDAASFLVRLTDVTTHNNKTFRLDGVSIEVAYTP